MQPCFQNAAGEVCDFCNRFKQLSSIEEVIVNLGDYELKSPCLQMLQFQLVVVHLALVITLLQWHSISVLLVGAASEPLEPSVALDMRAHPVASGQKSATNLAAKLFLLDELVSLENEVTETKKKRSFPGFGSPIDRISSTSVDVKGKQRKVVELPKRRFGVPLDRIGVSHLSSTKG
ncbi:osteocrin isoform X2 [Pezoporus flaviventris]|nr:osteocrin isoform X2 [Pezoporus flaviventris]